jgi:hypothetical protein
MAPSVRPGEQLTFSSASVKLEALQAGSGLCGPAARDFRCYRPSPAAWFHRTTPGTAEPAGAPALASNCFAVTACHMPFGKVASAASLGMVDVPVPAGTVLPAVVLTAVVGGTTAVLLGLVVSPVVDGADVAGAGVDGTVMGAGAVVTTGAAVVLGLAVLFVITVVLGATWVGGAPVVVVVATVGTD